MKKLLHIIATPRREESRTLQVSSAFLEALESKQTKQKEYADDAAWHIDVLDLAKEQLPPLTLTRVDGKYVLLGGKDLDGEMKEAWAEIVMHIERFTSADAYLISAPMWNFSIPYMLKHYLDVIIQPKYLFRYTETGAIEGLVKNKKMVIITSRGGDYSGAMKSADFEESYLRAVFSFVGISDITFINAEPMDMGEALQKQKIKEAKDRAVEIAKGFFS